MSKRNQACLGLLLSAGVIAMLCLVQVPTNSGTASPQDPPKTKVVPHPLDPLSRKEMATTVAVLQKAGKLSKTTFFSTIALQEPDKKVVYNFKPGDAIQRKAFVVLLDRESNQVVEAVIDLNQKKIEKWLPKKGAHPALLWEEFTDGGNLVRNHPDWRKALQKRGIHTFSEEHIQLDCWAAGFHPASSKDHKDRIVRVIGYLRAGSDNAAMGNPIDGLSALVNLTKGRVIEVIDTGVVPVPPRNVNFYEAKVRGMDRKGLKPLLYAQPRGRSYQRNGNEIRWQNWRFRFALHPREGLVLYTIGYEENGKVRPVLYRASISEMLVPYGDPDNHWFWRNAFDQGEYGLGRMAVPLRTGQELPNHAEVVDAIVMGDRGEVVEKPGAVGIYEEDNGILWTHWDYISEKTITRRARALVLYNLFTIGNYDYGLKWSFHQDGTLEATAELTGILLAKGVKGQRCTACAAKPGADGIIRPTGGDRYGTLVDPNVVAVNHQHFLNFRLDLDVDGVKNSVREQNVVPVTVPGNDPGNAFLLEQMPLKSEKQASRHLNATSRRTWKIFHADKQNETGHFPGYLLEPGADTRPFFSKKARVAERGLFSRHAFWTTRYHAEERYAAGDYPNLSQGSQGLPQWVSNNESLEQQDLVVWYNLGVTHIPRPEEWPIMCTARAGFKLLPHGFFLRNPALNVPESK